MKCEIHDSEMTLSVDSKRGGFGRFRCHKGTCRGKDYSVAKGTCFEGTNLAIETVLSILYSYAVNDSYEDCRREAIAINDDCIPSDVRLSDNTIADWYV
jgi:hypothetical protein